MTQNGNSSKQSFSTFEERRPRTPLGPFTESGRGKTCQIRLPEAYKGYIRSYLLEDVSILGLYQLYKKSLWFSDYEKWKIYAKESFPFKESDIHRLWLFFRTDYWKGILENDDKLKEII